MKEFLKERVVMLLLLLAALLVAAYGVFMSGDPEESSLLYFQAIVPAVRFTLILFLFGAVVMVPCLAIHESAHALIGAVLGLRIFTVEIGTGPLLWATNCGGTRIELRAWIFRGLTRWGSPHPELLRLRLFVGVLAGPLVNAALFLALFEAQDRQIDRGLMGGISGSYFSFLTLLFMWTNGWMVVLNLLPFQYSTEEGLRHSDGLLLCTIPFYSKKTLDEFCAAYFLSETERAFTAGDRLGAEAWVHHGTAAYPDSPVLRYLDATMPLQKHEFAVGFERCQKLYAAPDLPPPMRASIADLLATALLLEFRVGQRSLVGGDPVQTLQECERYCEEAITLAKDLSKKKQSNFRATRGSLWIEQGRLDDGCTELRGTLADLTPAAQSISLSYLALAEGRKGNREACKQLLAKAFDADKESPVPASVMRDLADLLGTPVDGTAKNEDERGPP